MAEYRKYRDMSDDELVSLRRDTALTLDAAAKKAVRLRASQERIKRALRMREDGHVAPGGQPAPWKVVDHAVVRYLERVKGIDMNLIRQEIRDMVDKGIAEERTGDDVILCDGYVVLTSERKITTVLTQEMYENVDVEPEGD